jgi:hypothetical protein
MYVQTEILYPPRVTPQLREACGAEWRKLVDHVTTLDEAHPENLAFTLTMIRLDGCLDCETDSFRAMRGCAACALQNLRKFRKNEKDLLKQYKAALKEVQTHLKTAERAATALA